MGIAAHDDGPAPQLRPAQLLDRREERVEVEVGDHGSGGRGAAGRRRSGERPGATRSEPAQRSRTARRFAGAGTSTAALPSASKTTRRSVRQPAGRWISSSDELAREGRRRAQRHAQLALRAPPRLADAQRRRDLHRSDPGELQPVGALGAHGQRDGLAAQRSGAEAIRREARARARGAEAHAAGLEHDRRGHGSGQVAQPEGDRDGVAGHREARTDERERPGSASSVRPPGPPARRRAAPRVSA